MTNPPAASPVDRRAALRVLFGAAGALAAVPRLQVPSRGPGTPPAPLGPRSPFEHPVRIAGGGVSYSPLGDLVGTITPSDLHYEVHHAGIPSVDPTDWKLLVHGDVVRPTVFTLDDLRRFPSRSLTCFLECGGNYPIAPPPGASAREMAGLTSQSEWTGVPLGHLLREAGLRDGAAWILAESLDGVALARSVPLRKALDDALLAYGQNGEALRPAQGYPVRLLLPGYEGNMSVKWLRRLEVGTQPFMTRWETSRYSEPIRGGSIRFLSFIIEARSIITDPVPPKVLAPGWREIRGLAWSGRGVVRHVDVTTDGGGSWQRAELDGPVQPKAHTRFRFPWRWTGEPARIASRVVDESGYVQPTQAELIAARGPAAPYHLNPIVFWQIDGAGAVSVAAEPWPG